MSEKQYEVQHEYEWKTKWGYWSEWRGPMTWAGVLADFAARKNEIEMFSIARGKMICRRNFNVREYDTKRGVLSVHDIYRTPFILEPK